MTDKALRIGVYICHCGVNIAGKVDVETVRDHALSLSQVAVARDYKFMCSEPGQAMIEADIGKFGLTRVVVASCSPRLHANTFMDVCTRAGINPYFFQMASIREQVSWVTRDPLRATEKAKVLVTAAVSRVRFHSPLIASVSPVHPEMAVVGGGIAGMQAAIDMGNAGYHVYLVERDTTIGGHMLQFDKTFPTLDCAACIGTPKMVEVAQNPNIELLSCSRVTAVEGFVGNFTLKIERRPRFVDESKCTGCGECAKACPVSVPNAWDVGLADRKAIGRAFPQAIPITYNIEKGPRAPCVSTCPAGINVQGYVQMIAQKEFARALALILEKAPLPGVLGRVCPHPCEGVCRRALADEPLAIRQLKRFAADAAWPPPVPQIADREERVGVVGAGPAGLTAAYFLRREGFRVTLFDAADRPGGMLRTGIPDYRLPREILDREIDHILAHGIEFRPNTRLGRDLTFSDLARFDALFLGLGAQTPLRLGIDGEKELEGVTDALSFLGAVNLGSPTACGGRVVVVGGGNVALDAARCARRIPGCKVTIVYRRTKDEMPAYEDEIAQALEEGIKLLCLTSPVRLEGEGGRVAKLICLRNELGDEDASGRRRPVAVAGSEFSLPCDTFIPAIGQVPDVAGLEPLAVDAENRVVVENDSLATSVPGVFSGGDSVLGPATVVEAVAQGRRAAGEIRRYLERAGAEETDAAFQDREAVAPEPRSDPQYPAVPEHLPAAARACSEMADPETRTAAFDEVEAGFTEAQALAEAGRCLNCGICCECMACVGACEVGAVNHDMEGESLSVKVGSVIIATGYDILDPSAMPQYGYGKYPNVFTALEFERISNATGPTGGQILMRDAKGKFSRPPEAVALVHCVGSRDVNFHPYCSRVCCMYALKYTHLIKEKVGRDTAVYDFYIDMRCFGEGYEEFYRRCQEEGTTFIRGKVAKITNLAQTPGETGKLVAVAEDTLLSKVVRVPVDMVVLCTAIQARADAGNLGRVFGLNQGADGFFLEAHPKLAPVNTASDGIFLSGCCQKPMDIPDTVSQASGAAAKALALAARGEVSISPTTSHIDPDICAGCKTCIGVCPYSAITFDERLSVARVNTTLCKGCGSCSGVCPSGAARSRHFMKKQLFAEITGVL